MAQKTDAEKISELLDNYLGNNMDICTLNSVKEKANEALNTKGHTAQTVADVVFDYVHDNFSGDAAASACCQQVCPKTILYVLRNEIIAALK